jgi:hypothetical protein
LASRRTRWLALSCAGVIAVVIGVTAWRGSRGPAVDQAQARAMRPVIDGYLDNDAGKINGRYLATAYPKLTVKAFCDAGIIESRPDGPQWRVGTLLSRRLCSARLAR